MEKFFSYEFLKFDEKLKIDFANMTGDENCEYII
jgi:hypothetical protein